MIRSLALVLAALLAACSSSTDYGIDAAPDLSLPAQVTHVGVDAPVCCIETTSTAPRALYLANPKPGGSDSRGHDVATTGELHLADAYGFDAVLANGSAVPRNSYLFTPDGSYIVYLQKSAVDATYALVIAALAPNTIGAINPIIIIPRGLDNTPLDQQAFFSPSGRYLVVGVLAKGITNSSDLTVVEVETGTVVFTLPNGSFDYIEQVTSSDTLVYENSVASKVPGTPSVEGLFVLPLAAAAAGGVPALIDTHTAQFALTPDERSIVYAKSDGTLWLYGLANKTHLQIGSNIVNFTMGANTAAGPLVFITTDFSLHVQYLLQPELLATAPNTIDPWASFTFSPRGDALYYFDRTSSQDSVGDLYRLPLVASSTPVAGALIDRRVSTTDLTFIANRMRYIRNVDGRGDYGELVYTALDGSDVASLASGVALGSLREAKPVAPTAPVPKPSPAAPVDMLPTIVPPVWAQIVNATRNLQVTGVLFDSSAPVVGALAFSRDEGTPVMIDPAVHVGSYTFSPDGYALLYAGGATYNASLKAYLGTMNLYQTLVDQNPVAPMLNGVSEIGTIRDRATFVAAPGASPAGAYFIRY